MARQVNVAPTAPDLAPLQFFYPDTPDLPLPPGHCFPAGKYRMLRDKIARERILEQWHLAPSPLAEPSDIERAHSPAYVRSILDGTIGLGTQRRIGLPWSEILVLRSRATVGGAIAAARRALCDGLSGQLAGGTHHAHRDFGSGYCMLNDLAIAALTVIAERRAARIAIVDLDVHQGDGNAAILRDIEQVFVLSLHGEKNFPFRKIPSDLDVGLPDGTGDTSYLRALSHALDAVTGFRPDLVLYLSGVDPLRTDALGRLALSFEGLARRDRLVFETCRRRAIPVSIAIGGGYANPITDSVEAYANTFRVAREVFHF